MRATFTPQIIRPIAARAVEHWLAKWQERREAWIEKKAAETLGTWRPRPIGRAAAEEIFPVAWSGRTDGASGGRFWPETQHYWAAQRLAAGVLSGAASIILNADDLDALAPVWPVARKRPSRAASKVPGTGKKAKPND